MQLYPDKVLSEIIPHPKADQLRNARGKQYGKLIREVYNDFAWQLEVAVLSQGRVSVTNLAQLAIASNLCLKHTVEFLEWRSILPTGTYDRRELPIAKLTLWRGLLTSQGIASA